MRYGSCSSLIAILIASMLASHINVAAAQTNGPAAPPNVDMVDENFVNYASGVTAISIPLVSIGSGDLGMAMTGYFDSGAWMTTTNLTAKYEYDAQTGNQTISLGRGGDSLPYNGGTALRNGGLLVRNGDNSRTVFLRDGTRLDFANNALTAHKVIWPSGKQIQFSGMLLGTNEASAFQNNGILLKQQSDGTIVIINTAYEYCDPNPSVRCKLSQSWPTASQAMRSHTNSIAATRQDVWNTVIDQAGGRYELEAIQGMLTRFVDKRSSSEVPRIYERCTVKPVKCYYTSSSAGLGSPQTSVMTERVISAQRRGNHWSFNYTWNAGPYGSLYTGNGPSGKKQVLLQSPRNGFGYVASYSDANGSYTFDGLNRVTMASTAGAGEQRFAYDERSNLISVTYLPRAGSTEAQQGASAFASLAFDASCASMAKCNKPNSYTDRNNQRTDYLYDATTGQVLRETKPAVDGIRSVVRYGYSMRHAWYLGSSGGYVRSPSAISLLTTEKTCRTSATLGDNCAAANDEVVKTYDYGPDRGPNNLWLLGVAVSADGVTRLTCYDYDRFGNRIRETTPRAGRQTCY